MTPLRRVILPIRSASPAFAFFVVALWLALVRVVTVRVYMDEQLFIGGAGLMARGEGLIYRDFFYNHMPVQPLVTAGLFKLTRHWTLVARALDAICGAAVATLLFEAARRAFIETTPFWRAAMGTAIGAIFLFNPVTADALGKAWNHNLAALACLAGFIILAIGIGKAHAGWWAFASGACAAIAVTTRLTYAPPVTAFPLLILLAPGLASVQRWRLLGLWTLGAVIAASPSLWVLLQSPRVAYFDNIQFPRLNTPYFAELGGTPRATLAKKFEYVQLVLSRSRSLQVVTWLTVAAMLVASRPWRVRASLDHCRFACLTVVLAAACAAAFVPTPMFHQYLYGPVPFAVLAIAWGAASMGLAKRWWARVSLLGVAVLCVAYGHQSYGGFCALATPKTWTPNLLHQDGKRLARLAAPGKVLTFMPGVALEAGLPIYPELSIGRYTLRVGHLITAEERAKYRIPHLNDVRRWFIEDPPGAVLLVDPTSSLEADVAAIAVAHGYVPQSFRNSRTLYLPRATPTTQPLQDH